CLQYSNSPYSF
nr:immunoglobulin light chain junction region [Macaca mulatta]MOW08514.1 immunoglobulin light chain junction region [Macaca mulatta]MOW08771.1 immunoglobulin light chain junction region [Macaca mulatta]MOW09042.1 immunoglobulin light chain junction region [Macaca mulatta]MOW09103.1 immunoglobulin light chain junction region [Macaca mulatta]